MDSEDHFGLGIGYHLAQSGSSFAVFGQEPTVRTHLGRRSNDFPSLLLGFVLGQSTTGSFRQSLYGPRNRMLPHSLVSRPIEVGDHHFGHAGS